MVVRLRPLLLAVLIGLLGAVGCDGREGFEVLEGHDTSVDGADVSDAYDAYDAELLNDVPEELDVYEDVDFYQDTTSDVHLDIDVGDIEVDYQDIPPDVPLDTVASPPAEVLQTGTRGLLLRGVVLTRDGVLDPGEVLVDGNSIVCVANDCTPWAANATWIDTKGTISAGLIDAHNHMAYNFLPEWVPNPIKVFHNRYEWANDPDYEAFILPYTAHRSANTHFCPGAKWAELRSLIHGTTTMQGQPSAAGSCIDGTVRNANRYHGFGFDHMRGTIGSPRDITDADAASYMASFTDPVEPITRFHVHMCEGVSGNNILTEFDSFAGRDTRTNRHAGMSLLEPEVAILIHSVALDSTQLQEVSDTNATIVWSPSSNFALYGQGVTAPIQEILQRGIPTAIGPDWTLSGSDEMLSELRVGLDYGVDANIPELTPKKLWEMSTWDGAYVLGLNQQIGSLEIGKRADIAVFGRTGENPYKAVIDSRAADVRLVLIDGVGYFGDLELEAATARNAYCELLDACGRDKYLCTQDSPTAANRRNETMADLHQQLYNILQGVGYPADEQYGRGSELLELVDCGL